MYSCKGKCYYLTLYTRQCPNAPSNYVTRKHCSAQMRQRTHTATCHLVTAALRVERSSYSHTVVVIPYTFQRVVLAITLHKDFFRKSRFKLWQQNTKTNAGIHSKRLGQKMYAAGSSVCAFLEVESAVDGFSNQWRRSGWHPSRQGSTGNPLRRTSELRWVRSRYFLQREWLEWLRYDCKIIDNHKIVTKQLLFHCSKPNTSMAL